jgi:flagellar biosynthesis protein FlhA
VSKAGVEGEADKAVFGQLSANPPAMGMVSGAALAVGLLPGMPFLPFAGLAAGAGAIAFFGARGKQRSADADAAAEAVAEQAQADAVQTEAPIEETLHIDELKIELGYGLLPLINDVEGRRLTDQVKALRKNLAQETGFVLPSVRIVDNMQFPGEQYAIKVKEMDAGTGDLKMSHLLAMDPTGAQVDLPGEHVKEPAFGLPATWIEEGLREEATFRGYTLVDPAAVLVTHLTEILRENMADLLSYAETEKLLEALPKEHKKLLEDITPSQISRAGIQRILQNLLKERVSIRDLPAIIEGVAEASSATQNLDAITEHVRTRLSRQICYANRGPDGTLPVLSLSPQWEQAFAEALVGEGERRQLALAPSKLRDFVAQVRDGFDRAGAAGDVPVLLTSPQIRPYVRSLAERFRPQTVIMSQNEIHPSARLKTVGQV